MHSDCIQSNEVVCCSFFRLRFCFEALNLLLGWAHQIVAQTAWWKLVACTSNNRCLNATWKSTDRTSIVHYQRFRLTNFQWRVSCAQDFYRVLLTSGGSTNSSKGALSNAPANFLAGAHLGGFPQIRHLGGFPPPGRFPQITRISQITQITQITQNMQITQFFELRILQKLLKLLKFLWKSFSERH